MASKLRAALSASLARAATGLLEARAPPMAALATSAAVSLPRTSAGVSAGVTQTSLAHTLAAHPSLATRGPLAALASGVAPMRSADQPRGFRPTAVTAAAADPGLVDALDAEIAHEKNSYAPPEGLAHGPPSPFTVESNPGAAELVLRRSFEGEDIEVVASSPEYPEMDEPDDEEGVAEAADEGPPDDIPYVPVKVSVTKKGPGGLLQTLEFECGLEGAESDFVIEGVTMKSSNVKDGSIAYEGPDYLSLEPSLQDQFAAYLTRRGFNGKLGSFIRDATDDKDQQEYVDWLQRVKGFLE